MRLRSHLKLIVFGTLLPVLVLTAVLIVLHHTQMRRATERGLEETARALSAGVDRELGASIGALEVLAASETLRTGHHQQFDRVARTVLRNQRRWTHLVLYDPMGRQLASLGGPFGPPSQTMRDVELIERVVGSRTPAISNLYQERPSGRWLVRLAVAVPADGALRSVLAASIDPASLVELLSQVPLPAGSLVSLIDRNYVIVARSRAAEQFVGQPATPDFVALASRMSQGSFRAQTKEGETVYVSISRSPLSGWTIGLGVPQAVVDGPLRTSLWFLTGAAALMVLVGTTLAFVVGRRLERPMLALVRAAPRLGRGEVIALPRSSVTELSAVAAAVETASRELTRGQQAAAALARVSQAFTDTADVSAVGRQIVEHVFPLFESASANLRLLSADGSLQTVARHTALATPELEVDVMPPGMGITGAAVSAGIPIQSPNVPEDPLIQLTDGVRHMMVESGVVVWLAVPLRVNGKIIGALSIGDRTGRVFSPAEVTLLQTFADQAALALEQARLFEESEHRRQTAEALAEVGRLLSQTLDPHTVGTRIVESVQTLLAARSAVLYSLEADAGALTAHTVSTDLGLLSWTPRLERGVGTAWMAVDQRCPIMTPDVLADDRVLLPSDVRARLLPATHRALLAVPLVLPDRIVGALVVAGATGRVYSEHDAQIAQAFAAQAAIALENARLYQDLQRAYDDLAHTQAQLTQAQKMEAIGHLAGGIAHEFNNLLTVIVGRGALLVDQFQSGHPVRSNLEQIQNAADRATVLTRQLLAFSRRQVLQPRHLDLNPVVMGLLPMLRSVLGEQIEVAVIREAAPVFVRADQGQLEQAILNLIANARDAMPHGGRCTIRTATVSLDAAWAAEHPDLQAGRYAVLEVADTGHGMRPEVRARVFDPFFTTKGVGQGTGLGLSMAHGMIAQHGGTIVVESEEGHGSTFTIYLPQTVSGSEPGSS